MTPSSHAARPGPPDDDTPSRPTVRLASIIAPETPLVGDPTDDFHEASRVYPGMVDPNVTGAARLENGLAMRLSASRGVKRHVQRRFVPLPRASFPSVTLDSVLASRRSRRAFSPGDITIDELATLLWSASGVTETVAGSPQTLRTTPSGGALYPLELYVAAIRVADLPEALYHYDPLRHGLERVGEIGSSADRHALSPYGETISECTALVIVTAMLWRSRFKYGARAYRFVLIEAGHLVQNVALCVEALGLAATPIGGFFDRIVDTYVGIDGVNEASVYLVPIGRRA